MIKQKSVAVEATRKTPRVLLEQGKIYIKGRAIPENPGEFFRPLYEWISWYIKNPSQRTEIELGFEYINTSSIKWIYAILKEIAGIEDSYARIRVTWNYEREDEDMHELGLMLKSFIDCPFLIIAVDIILDKE
jgi:hypothetical protein